MATHRYRIQMKHKLSIHDIARQLNVSATTVSFVLNGKAARMRISKRLENRILKYVSVKRYQPNSIARSLRTGKARTSGHATAWFPDPLLAFYHGSGAACI